VYQQNQQNPYQQQSFGTQPYQLGQGQQRQVYLEDLDLANFVLSELKRIAREYTTAALESANPQIRHAFQSLVQKTLQDQAAVFQEIQKLGGYEIQPAAQQQLQQELQKQSQSAAKLQSFVQHHLSTANSSSYQQQNQGLSQQQQQSQNLNQIAALQQAPFQPAPTISASAFPNAVYNQGFSQQTNNAQNTYNQQQSYSGLQGQSLQDQSYGQSQGYGASDYGTGDMTSSSTGQTSGYASGGLASSEMAGQTGTSTSQQATSRSQTSGQSSQAAGESSYANKRHGGSKYSF
jgi:spore coat protein CotF